MSKIFKIAAVQYDTFTTDIGVNVERALALVRDAKECRADLVVFPECFLTMYWAPDICKQKLKVSEIEGHPDFIRWCKNTVSKDDANFSRIRELAAELNIGVMITGLSMGKKYPQNTAWLIDRDGNAILKYSKVHTCDFNWEGYLESGDSFPVCTFDGIKIGCMICYDREYPESARELMLNGAEFILHPNNCYSMMPRLRELSVRAMENMVCIVMANPPGKGMGNSCAYSPFVWTKDELPLDNTIFVGDELEETIYYFDFDIDEIREYRNREDLGKYRKPGAYKNLTKDRNHI